MSGTSLTAPGEPLPLGLIVIFPATAEQAGSKNVASASIASIFGKFVFIGFFQFAFSIAPFVQSPHSGMRRNEPRIRDGKVRSIRPNYCTRSVKKGSN